MGSFRRKIYVEEPSLFRMKYELTNACWPIFWSLCSASCFINHPTKSNWYEWKCLAMWFLRTAISKLVDRKQNPRAVIMRQQSKKCFAKLIRKQKLCVNYFEQTPCVRSFPFNLFVYIFPRTALQHPQTETRLLLNLKSINFRVKSASAWVAAVMRHIHSPKGAVCSHALLAFGFN